ncbi:MAG TPA: hypothetical protein VGA09_03195 [Candidatus Binatia bacterium]
MWHERDSATANNIADDRNKQVVSRPAFVKAVNLGEIFDVNVDHGVAPALLIKILGKGAQSDAGNNPPG